MPTQEPVQHSTTHVYKQLGCELKLLPLKFAQLKYESKYKDKVAYSCRTRVPLMGLLHAIILCIFWSMHSTSPTLKLGQYLSPNEDYDTAAIESILSRMVGTSFHIGMALNLLCDLWMMVMWFTTCGSREYATYGLLLIQQISSFIFLTLTGSTPLPHWNNLEDIVVVETALLSHEIVIWVYLAVTVLLLTPLLAMNAIMPCRTCISWILLGAFAIAVFGTFHLTFARFQTFTSQRTCAALSVSNFFLGLMSFGGRYQRELQERIDFWSHLRNQLRLKVLHHEVQRLSPSKDTRGQGESTVEEVIALLRHSQKLVAQVSQSVMVPDLINAEEIITEVLRVLSHGGNLFQVRFSNLPEEGESIIDQYIWGKSFVRSASNGTLADSMESASPRRPKKPMKTCREAMDVIKQKRDDRSPTPIRMTLPQQTQHPAVMSVDDIAMDEMAGQVGVEWAVNVFEFQRRHPQILVQFGACLLLPLAEYLQTPSQRILRFLSELQDNYLQNPYHNAAHAALVAHSTSSVIQMLDLPSGPTYTPMTQIVHIVAALGHDVGHPARTNIFFVNIFDPLAVIYNDRSVLENYHAFMTFQILQYDDCDIFRDVLLDSYRDVRRRIIEIILATDMKEHYEAMSKFRIRRDAQNFNMKTELEDMWLVIRMVVKLADLSHACVDWDQHFEWSCRIQEEFYQQGEEEEAMGYQKSPLCDRNDHPKFAQGQKGFLEYVVAPMISDISLTDDKKLVENVLKSQLMKNRDTWARLEAAGTLIEFPPHIRPEVKRNHSRTSSAIMADQMVAFHRLRSSMRTSSHPDSLRRGPTRTRFANEEGDRTHRSVTIAVRHEDERGRRNVRWQPR